MEGSVVDQRRRPTKPKRHKLASGPSHTSGDVIVEIDRNHEPVDTGLAVQASSSETTCGNETKVIGEKTGLVTTSMTWLRRKLRRTGVGGRGDETALQAADEETKHTVTKALESYQHGYPLLAAFQASEHSFSMYRGFSYLHSRVILELQDELRCLEESLNDLDLLDSTNPDSRRKKRLKSRAFDLLEAKRQKQLSQRATLLNTIRTKLVQYDEILAKTREINSFQRPATRDYLSVRRWLRYEKPLTEKEEQFIMRRDDLVSLWPGAEWGTFDGWVEDCIHKMDNHFLTTLFSSRELRGKSNSKHAYYYSAANIEALTTLLITVGVFVLLILPIVAMYTLTSDGNQKSTSRAIGVLAFFTLLFPTSMSVLTRPKRHELFAASAAYTAVLVVFVGNFDKGQ